MYKDKNGDIWQSEEIYKEYSNRVEKNLKKSKIGFEKYKKSLLIKKSNESKEIKNNP